MKCPSCDLDGLNVRIIQETWAVPVEVALDNVVLIEDLQTETTFHLVCLHCQWEYRINGVDEV